MSLVNQHSFLFKGINMTTYLKFLINTGDQKSMEEFWEVYVWCWHVWNDLPFHIVEEWRRTKGGLVSGHRGSHLSRAEIRYNDIFIYCLSYFLSLPLLSFSRMPARHWAPIFYLDCAINRTSLLSLNVTRKPLPAIPRSACLRFWPLQGPLCLSPRS